MSNIQVQLRRGTTAQHGSFTGAQGELTVDTDKNALVLHDGSTVGGKVIDPQDVVNVLDYGATGDGSTDDTTAIQAAINSGGKTILFPEGVYKISDTLEFTTSSERNILGEGAEILVDSSTTDVALWFSGEAYVADRGTAYWDVGTRTGGTALSGDVVRGDRSIQVASTTGITKGSWIRLASTDLFIPDVSTHRHGELRQVQEIDGTTLKLDGGLFAGYTAANTTVFPLVMPEVRIKGLKVTGADDENSLTGILLWECQNVFLDGVNVSGFNDRGIDIALCANVNVNGLSVNFATKSYSVTNRTSYGLVINSSQYVNITGGTLKGGRHSFATGGYDPCRFITLSGVTVMTNDVDNLDVAALDSHENIEFLSIRDCTIHGGADLSGTNIEVADCQLDVSEETLAALRIRPAATCEYIKANGNVIFGDSDSVGGIVIKHLFDNINVKVVETSGNNITINTTYQRPGIGFEPADVTSPTVTVWNCSNNRVLHNSTNTSSSGISNYDAANTTRIADCSKINLTNNYVVQGSGAGRALDIRRTTQAGGVYLSNNRFEATGAVAAFLILKHDKVVLVENEIIGGSTPAENKIQYADRIEVVGGLVTNALYNGIRYQNYTTLSENNLRRENCTVDHSNFTPTNTFTAHSWGIVDSSGTLGDGYNISSVSKITTGQYRVTFSNRQRANDYPCFATRRDSLGDIRTVALNYNSFDVYTGTDTAFSFVTF